jgi:hypothetical protein
MVGAPTEFPRTRPPSPTTAPPPAGMPRAGRHHRSSSHRTSSRRATGTRRLIIRDGNPLIRRISPIRSPDIPHRRDPLPRRDTTRIRVRTTGPIRRRPADTERRLR